MKYDLNDIKNYVDGTMTSEERMILEHVIDSDEDLRLMITGYKEMKDIGYTPDAWIKSKKILPTKSNKTRRSILNLAAVIIIILTTSISIYFLSNKSHFQPPRFKDAGIPIYMNHEKLNKWGKVMEFYRNENFEAALQEILIVESKHNVSDTSLYYKGIFLKESEKYEEAFNIFNGNKIKDPLLKEKADVQKIDCLWLLGHHEEALKHFNNATSDKNHFIHHLLNDQ